MNTEEVAAINLQVAVAVGAKIPSCVYCEKGSDEKGAVSPEREGRGSASHWCFTPSSVEGFQLHFVVWEQGFLGTFWECKSHCGLLLGKEAALPVSVWGVAVTDCWWALQGWCWESPVCLCSGWSQGQGCAPSTKQVMLRKCHLSRSLSRPQRKSAGKS